MIDATQIMPLNFFSYGGIYTGEHEGMRYRIIRGGNKPDYQLKAYVWREPFAYDYVSRQKDSDSLIETEMFEFSEEGRICAIDWLLLQFETRKAYWLAKPALTDISINI